MKIFGMILFFIGSLLLMPPLIKLVLLLCGVVDHIVVVDDIILYYAVFGKGITLAAAIVVTLVGSCFWIKAGGKG